MNDHATVQLARMVIETMDVQRKLLRCQTEEKPKILRECRELEKRLYAHVKAIVAQNDKTPPLFETPSLFGEP